jgi:O-antigen biosynthesis protein
MSAKFNPVTDDMHSISVVIPARDAASCISVALESLVSERVVIREILIIDDGSIDGTGQIALSTSRQYRLPTKVHRVHFADAGAARNAGIGRAQGEFVFFLDADDEVLQGGLMHLLARLRADRSAGVALGGYYRRRRDRPDVVKVPRRYSGDCHRNANAYLRNWHRSIAMGSALLTREAAARSCFPERLLYDEDTLYWASILSKTGVTTTDRPVLIYNVEDGKMNRRFTSSPRRYFLRISREIDAVGTIEVAADTLRWRRGWIALRVARALIAQGEFTVARRFLRVARAAHPRFRFGLTAFRYSLRARSQKARRLLHLAGQRGSRGLGQTGPSHRRSHK